jgi:hypothetical protein
MKIKRFDNLWLMGLILCGAILGGVYILKIFFPNFVIEVAHIESITRIGHYIDNHKWAWYLASILLSFVTYYFTACACCKTKSLNTFGVICVIATVLSMYTIKEFLPALYVGANACSMILLPFILRADFKATTVVFVSTTLLQSITLTVRDIAIMVIDANYATMLILTIDYYILLGLLYFYYNYETEKE